MDTSKLRPDTAKAWEVFKEHPLLAGFILIGGTALTMHVGHRVSEDLDFACIDRDQLPRQRLHEIVRDLSRRGHRLELNQNPLAIDDFIDTGLELDNDQQDFIFDGSVKVSFVCYDPPMDQLLMGDQGDPLRVATLTEAFETKALVCSERSKSRDWLDLYVLMTSHGYTMRMMYEMYKRIDMPHAFSNAKMRMRSCRVDASDEGYAGLMTPSPSLVDIRDFFNVELDDVEKALAREAFSTPGRS